MDWSIQKMLQIEFDDVIIKQKQLIKKNTMDIAENAVTMITGDNGTGKSILLRRLFCVCNEKGIPAYFVEQGNDYFWKKSTVLENICLSESDDAVKKARKLLETLQFEHLEQHKITELSGGEKRILSILRAVCLAKQHGIIFMDEPTNDLDIEHVTKLKQLLSQLKNEISIVIVSHDDRMFAVADKTYTIFNQELQADSPSGLSKSSGLSEHKTGVKDRVLKENTEMQYDCMCKSIVMKGVVTIIAVILAAISVYGTMILTDQKHSFNSTCEEREFDIMIPTTALGSEIITKETIPIRMLSLIQNNLSIGEKFKKYNEILNTSLPVNYGLNEFLHSENGHTMFALEYFNSMDDEYVYPMDYYCKIKGIDSNAEIENSPFFRIDEEDESETIPDFDAEAFQECTKKLVEDYKDKNPQCTFVTVVLRENETLESFLSNPSVMELMEGNYYVRSREVASFVQQLEILFARRNAMIVSLELSICILLLGILLTIIVLYSSRKVFLVARDVSAEQKLVASAVQKHLCNLRGVFCVLFAAIAGNTILIGVRGGINYVGNFLCLMACLFFVLILYKAQRIIEKNYIRYLWSWKRR